MDAPLKREGFPGQIIHFSPLPLIGEVRRHALGVGLHAIHLGSFPAARGHEIRRAEALKECILISCYAGRGWFEIDGVRRTVDSGQVLLIPMNKPHAYGADERKPWSIDWAHFSGTSAACYFSLLPPHEYGLSLDTRQAREVRRLFQKCFSVLARNHTARGLLLVSHVLRHILGAIFFQGGKRAMPASKLARHDVSDSLHYMRQNLTRTLSLETLARQASLSPPHYSALFREQTGMSPVGHHIRLRMQAACHWLDTTALSVKEVAARMGYDDAYYFSRVFRKTIGLSPLGYRRSIKG